MLPGRPSRVRPAPAGPGAPIYSPLRFGIGYGLPQLDVLPWIPDEKICYWGGWGGSMIVMDVGRRMTISYMMNKMSPGIVGSDRSAEYGKAIYDAVTS